MKYRAAIIGCGKIGSEFADDPRIKGIFSHAGAYVACPETELVAICDSEHEKREICMKRWNLDRAYSDYKEMLQCEKPDIVSVCTPDHTHAKIITDLLKSRGIKAIIAEKPLTTDLKSADAIVREASAKKIILAVNYTRRFDPAHQKIQDLIQSGKIGTVQTINAFYSKGTLHNGTHIFDLARFLGGEITAVRGLGTLDDYGIDPTISIFCSFQSGATGFFHACDERAFTIFEMDIIGSKGRIRILESGNIIEIFSVVDDPFYSGYQGLCVFSKLEGMTDVLLHVVEDVVDSITHKREPRCTGEDAVRALRIAIAARNSVRRNGRLTAVSH